MVLETAQLLSTVNHLCSPVPPEGIYKATHKNHPCTIWARKSVANYRWLYKHGIALAEEYTHRYGKRHKSQDVIESCKQVPTGLSGLLPFDGFALAMPEIYKESDPVQSYRNYYRFDKLANIDAQWNKNRNKPEWLER